MKKIWKYELQVTDEQYIEMPHGANLLCVQVQRGVPCLWAEVFPEQRKVKRKILTVGTGHTVPDIKLMSYLGTYQIQNIGGEFVFHVYDAFEGRRK